MPHRHRPVPPIALIVTPGYLPLLGGMERECALLAEQFRRRGYEPVILTETQGLRLPRRERIGDVLVVRIRSSRRRSLGVQLWVAANLVLLVLRHRRRVAFGVIRSMTLPAVAMGLLKALRFVAFPTFVTAETRDDVGALRRMPLFRIARVLVSRHDVINGLTDDNVTDLYASGFPIAKITQIPNGIDISPWRTTKPPLRVRRLLFLGRLDREKGLYELLEALARVLEEHPDVTLMVAGEGLERSRLAMRARALELEAAVDFIGLVPYEELGALFESVDCIVLPSYSEAMPLSVLEAAAHRRVLVVSDVGDIRRHFAGNVHICRPRDVESLVVALKAAVARRPAGVDYEDLLARVDIETVAGALLERLGVDQQVS